MPLVLAAVEDLFFLVQIQDAAKRAGCELRTVRTPDELDPAANLFVVDLNSPKLAPLDLIAAARDCGIETLAFVPHVNTALRQQAIEAGAEHTVARSNFAAHLRTALEKIAAPR